MKKDIGIVVLIGLFTINTVYCQPLRELETYNVDLSQISVSGFSSGGCFSTQVHVVYSAMLNGVGVFAGAPYYCEGEFDGGCPADYNNININRLVRATEDFADAGEIDATSNMADDRAYVFNGVIDNTTPVGYGIKVEEYYQRYMPSANVASNLEMDCNHGMPVDRTDIGGPCDQSSNDCVLNQCEYNGAFKTLNHIYGGNLQRPSIGQPTPGDFYEFNQREYFYESNPEDWSMDTVGFAYIPTGCMDKSTPCKLHQVYHGCLMGRQYLEDCYAREAGYNEVGELNDIILLYPQVISSVSNPVNPWGCYDWWGFNDPVDDAGMFATRRGHQNVAVRRMLDKAAGRDEPNDPGFP